jgi:hypothetical protein
MPPVVVMGSRSNQSRPHSMNPSHHHETYYPFKWDGSNGKLSHPDMTVVHEEFGARHWQELFKSAHKADLGIAKEERKVVNDAVAGAGFNSNSDAAQGKAKNFR